VPQNTGAASAQPEAPTAATQPATEAFEPQIDRLGNVLMDNGSGRWVAVNPKAVDKYLAQGWTYWGSGETSNAIPVLSSSAGTEANIYDLINGQNTAQAGSMAQLNSIINSLGSLTSSNNYQTILEKILAQNMPMYNSGKTEIQQQFQENAGNINADAERRGLFNSGVAAELQQKNDAAQVAELAKLLANVKSLSANQAQDAVGQQLQAAGLQGDMVTQGMQLSQSGIQNALNALLGLGDLGVAQQNANTNQQNANTNQQNADTNATSVSNQYNLGLLQLGVDQQRLDESARQFDARLALDRDLRNDDLKQFAQTMSLNWAQLNAQAKAQAADALYRARALDLDTRKFNSEQELIKAQQNQERLQVSFGAYDYLDKMFAQGATKEDLIAAIQPYKDLDAGLHSDLIDTVNRHFTTTTATQSSSGYNYTPPQNTGNIYSGFIR
jgi:hypothetical protein